MVAVRPSLGAVAVYSPARAGLLTAGVVLALLAGGYGLGRLAGDSAALATTAVVGPSTPARVRTSTSGPLPLAEMGRAYRAGVRVGAARRRPRGLAGAGRLRSGQPYIVVVRREDGRAPRVSFREPVRAGHAYRLCPSGRGICRQAEGRAR